LAERTTRRAAPAAANIAVHKTTDKIAVAMPCRSIISSAAWGCQAAKAAEGRRVRQGCLQFGRYVMGVHVDPASSTLSAVGQAGLTRHRHLRSFLLLCLSSHDRLDGAVAVSGNSAGRIWLMRRLACFPRIRRSPSDGHSLYSRAAFTVTFSQQGRVGRM
jgi:hypothetical protein